MLQHHDVAAALVNLRIEDVTAVRRNGERGVDHRQRLVQTGQLPDLATREVTKEDSRVGAETILVGEVDPIINYRPIPPESRFQLLQYDLLIAIRQPLAP